jgi:hypothetical protein
MPELSLPDRLPLLDCLIQQFKEAADVYPGEARPIPRPIRAMPK